MEYKIIVNKEIEKDLNKLLPIVNKEFLFIAGNEITIENLLSWAVAYGVADLKNLYGA